MAHEENSAHEGEPALSTPAPAGVDRSASDLEAAQAEAVQTRIAVLESRLARAEEENRAFVRSLRHAAAAAEELLDEARAEADALRVRAEADATMAREAARVEAHERVTVARADVRDALMSERQTLEAEVEALARVRRELDDDRKALVRAHAELSTGLRALVGAMIERVDAPAPVPVTPVIPEAPAVPPTVEPATSFATTVLTGPRTAAVEPYVRSTDAADDVRLPAGDLRRDEEHLERAFDDFFSSDVETEPSRRWILED